MNMKDKEGTLKEKLTLWHIRMQNTGVKLNSVMSPAVIYLEIYWKLLTLFYPFMWVELSRGSSS